MEAQRRQRLARDEKLKDDARKAESEEQRERRLSQNREGTAASRSAETEEQREHCRKIETALQQVATRNLPNSAGSDAQNSANTAEIAVQLNCNHAIPATPVAPLMRTRGQTTSISPAQPALKQQDLAQRASSKWNLRKRHICASTTVLSHGLQKETLARLLPLTSTFLPWEPAC
eukprot:INCI16005.2.p1 GENE.INCI16005.2~~INCI16005.2.p1  ORF type:complete len:175 (+),score=32.92 INCI16005.2:238-762(+)